MEANAKAYTWAHAKAKLPQPTPLFGLVMKMDDSAYTKFGGYILVDTTNAWSELQNVVDAQTVRAFGGYTKPGIQLGSATPKRYTCGHIAKANAPAEHH